MEAIILLPPILVIYLALPIMTGWVAKQSGRKFWFWAILTCFLPVLTAIILCFLPDIKEKSLELA